MRLSIPYLRFESFPFTNADKEDSVYNFSEKLINEKLIYKIDSTQHEDFSCLPVIVKENPAIVKEMRYFNTISNLTISFLRGTSSKNASFSQDC